MTEVWTSERLQAGQRAWRISLVGTVVAALGMGTTMPFLIVFLHGVRHASLPTAGGILALAAAVGLVSAPLGGILGDRLGFGRLLLGGLVVAAAGTGLLVVPAGLLEATGAVALSAVGQMALLASLNGLVAGQLPAHRRPRAYALRYGVVNAGLGAGGLVSGWIVSVHHPGTFQLVYSIDATSGLLFAAIVFFGLRRTPGYGPLVAAPPTAEPERPVLPGGYRAVLTDRPFVAFLGCALLFGVFGYAQLNGPWAAFVTLIVHASPRIVGIGFAANTFTIVGTQMGVAHLTRRWRRSRLLSTTGAIWTLAWIVTGVAHLPALSGTASDIALAAALGIFGFGETFLSPVTGALPNDLSPDHLRSRYNALGASIFPLGNMVGPVLAGVLLSSSAPISWVVVIGAGTALAALGGLRLTRLLPAEIDRPPLEALEGEVAGA